MYTLGGTYEETVAFLTGYYSGLAKCDLSSDAIKEWNQFSQWLARELHAGTSNVWSTLRDAHPSSSAALEALQGYATRYFNLP